MAKTPKPNLDEATVRIAQRMLNTPPKPHDQMKIGGAKRGKKRLKGSAATKRSKPGS